MNTNKKKKEILVIDPDLDWSFSSEDEMFSFFKEDIEKVEGDYKNLWQDLGPVKQEDKTLEFTLDNPSEVRERRNFFSDGRSLWLYIKKYAKKTELALCHCFNREPVFIYLHFSVSNETAASHPKMVEGDLIQRERLVPKGAIEGDSLFEGDEFSLGLYQAMLTLRSGDDISEEDFYSFKEVRENAIEEADEIWRNMDSYGNHLVSFIKEFEFTESGDDSFYYVAVTLEDGVSDSNVLLFSFPSLDENLIDRYRVGENLQSDEVVQEGSH